MNFNEYQDRAKLTASYPEIGGTLFVYPALGLAGETGEVVEKIKKIMRDEGGVVSDVKREEIKKELGDVLWYLSEIARQLEIPLEDVAIANIEKLTSRYARGVVGGSGDNR
jgi:NTP pyrophosphatase (non-canonical NTP hydrolase)